jgi:predicted deacylase
MKTRSINRRLLLAASLTLCGTFVAYPALAQPSVGTDSRLSVGDSPDLSRNKPGSDEPGKPGNPSSNVKKNAAKKAGAAAAAGVATKKVKSAVTERDKDDVASSPGGRKISGGKE